MEALSVLLLDDEKDLCFLLGTILEFNQFSVTATSEPEEAIVKLKSQKFDLLVVDFVMPRMNGLQVIEMVREELHLIEMKIILLTFKELTDDELLFVSRHDAVYYRKPFMPNDMVAKIHGLIHK